MIGSPPLQHVFIQLRSATSGDLNVKGRCDLNITFGGRTYTHGFFVCERLKTRVICGNDFGAKFKLSPVYDDRGVATLVETQQRRPPMPVVEQINWNGERAVFATQYTEIPGRSAVSIAGRIPVRKHPLENTSWDLIKPDHWDMYLNILEAMYEMPAAQPDQEEILIPITIFNHALDTFRIEKGEIISNLVISTEEIAHDHPLPHINETTLEVEEVCNICEQRESATFDLSSECNNEAPDPTKTILKVAVPDTPLETPHKNSDHKSKFSSDFITSPADVDTHKKPKLEKLDVPVTAQTKLKELCDEFEDVFSKGSNHLGKTSKVTMHVDTGDSPPVAQKPYPLALKHADWVRQEIMKLEEAGIIVKSVSPWASPIVVVPKKSAPGEPPRRRMCVDYRAINALLPPIKKVNSDAKGVLTLVPLPKIDDLFAELNGATIFSSLDLRMGYHHIGLDKESQPKTAFVIKDGKWEFTRVPFGLAQAPAYFQRLINEVLQGLPFARGYLDDILIFSKTYDEHLDHIKQVFQRLREADLKLKREKCEFFQAEIYYLGHVLTGKGIKPNPGKVKAITEMPAPKNVLEIQVFMGTANFYRKFVPRFSDLSIFLVRLTRKDEPWNWTDTCQTCFELIKEYLCIAPILRYPDPSKPYVLFTDASKFAWGSVLTQEHPDENGVMTCHPIHFLSGSLTGSQINWAALTKEAFAVYISCKKLTVYLTDSTTFLHCDHKPLERFLNSSTANTKVNNWAVELEQFHIIFDFIPGRKNVLADTMSRLVKVAPELTQEPEPPGYEFGYAVFEEVPDEEISVVTRSQSKAAMFSHGKQKVVTTPLQDKVLSPKVINAEDTDLEPVKVEVDTKAMIDYQQKDKFCKNILNQLQHSKVTNKSEFYLKDGVLFKRKHINLTVCNLLVIPETLQFQVAKRAHKYGHPGVNKLLAHMMRFVYWPNMKQTLTRVVSTCSACLKFNKKSTRYDHQNFKVERVPMHTISIDLIGELPETFEGHKYALTAIDMLTSYVWAVPIRDKTANSVIWALQKNVFKMGTPIRILSDNGTEFKNQLFANVCKQLGVKHHITTPPYHPQSNGKLEGFHYFLKTCVGKFITDEIEWDEVIDLAATAYNALPTEYNTESPFFLMFGRDPRTNLSELLIPRMRYLGDEKCLLRLDVLHAIYWLTAKNIEAMRRQKSGKIVAKRTMLAPNDLVIIKDPTAKAFRPKYKKPARIIKVFNTTALTIDEEGQQQLYNKKFLKKVTLAEHLHSLKPSLDDVGRLSKFYIDPTKLAATYNSAASA